MEEKYEKNIGINFNSLNSFLDKFKKIIGENTQNKDFIIESIEKELHKKIDKNNIKISKNILYLNISPIFKNEIYMRKEKILKSLEEKNINVIDIK